MTGKTKKKQTRTAPSKESVLPGKKGVVPDTIDARFAIVAILGIIVVIVIVVALAHLAKSLGDRSRFHWAQQKLSYVESQLGPVTGLKVSSTWDNHCSPTTEELFNNAQDCTTELDSEYTVSSQAQAQAAEIAIDSLMSSSKAFGFTYDPQVAQTDFNIPSKGLNCYWINGFTPDSGRVRDNVPTKISFIASCTAPSAATVYN